MNIRPVIQRNYVFFILKSVALFLCGASISSASLIINESFNSPAGGIPEGWSKFISGNGVTNVPIIEVSEYRPDDDYPIGDYRLMIRRDVGGAGGVMYTGTQGDIVDGVIQDFEVSTLVQISGTNDGRGIVARAQTTTFAFNGYWAFTKSLDGVQSLAISKNPTAAGVNHGEVLASVPLSERLTTSMEYLYTFSGIGNLLVAEVYKQDSEGDYTVLLGRVSVTDSSYSEGKVGHMVRHGGDGRSDYIRNFQVTQIPEPVTVSLITVLGIVCLLRRRR